MILADTSAWVEYDRATGSAVDRRLAYLIDDGAAVATTGLVVVEVLAGARSEAREADLRRLLLRFQLLRFDPAADFDGAARIYRRCRQQGITPRDMVDCMIASVAWRHDATLLAQHADLNRVAEVVGIDLDERRRRTDSAADRMRARARRRGQARTGNGDLPGAARLRWPGHRPGGCSARRSCAADGRRPVQRC